MIAAKADACFIMPPKKFLPLSERPTSPVCPSPSPANTLTFESAPGASQTEMCAWHPLPVKPSMGLGMKVAL